MSKSDSPLDHIPSNFTSFSGQRVALLASTDTKTVRRWADIGILKGVKDGGQLRYTRASVELLLKLAAQAERTGRSIPREWRKHCAKNRKGPNSDNSKANGSRQPKHVLPSMVTFDTEYYTSYRQIVAVAEVSADSARRYRREGRVPRPVGKLLDLSARGIILPDRWKHCFVNPRRNLEFFGVGEISEDEVTTARWMARIHEQRSEELEKELKAARARIKFLGEGLAELERPQQKPSLAANEGDFYGESYD